MSSATGPQRVGSVLVEAGTDVVRATLDRPGARNAIDESILVGLESAVHAAEERGARVLVVRGAGGTFCAGADLVQVQSTRHDPTLLDAFIGRIGAVLDRIEDAPFVSVAVVEGFAVAGGCELMLACDIAVAASTARIGDRHVEYGLVPGAGGSVRLCRTLPAAVARYLLLTGNLVDGTEAVALGLASMSVDPADLDARVETLVERLATRSRDALAVAKAMSVAARDLPAKEALADERRRCVEHIATSADVAEGLDAFVNRRPPSFR